VLEATAGREQLCNQATQASFRLSVDKPGKSFQEAMTQRLLFRTTVTGDGVLLGAVATACAAVGVAFVGEVGGGAVAQDAKRPEASNIPQRLARCI